MSDTIEIVFEGTPIAARVGESVAAALAAHGILSLRTTRDAAERGMFCGMGVCQDCLVEIDGKPEQRACMTKVDRPLQVRRQVHGRALAPVAEGASPKTEEVAVERPEVLVIGAGPGGLSAAIAARSAGAAVVVVDERAQPGGQYFKQVSVDPAGAAAPDRQHREGAALIETARRLGVEIRSGLMIWGAFEPGLFAAVAEGGNHRFAPKATIVATGAYESGWPVPGWTLPGVMTTGAAQTLWRTARRLPGRRVLIAGNGPLNLQLAAELIEGGAEVVAVVEAAPRPGPAKLRALCTMLATAPGLVRDGLRYHLRRRAGGAEMIHGSVVASVARSERGLVVQLDGAARSFEVDVLCLGYGFEPSNELLRVLGCGHDLDPVRRHLVTRRDDCGRTDVAGIYALGDCTGLGRRARGAGGRDDRRPQRRAGSGPCDRRGAAGAGAGHAAPAPAVPARAVGSLCRAAVFDAPRDRGDGDLPLRGSDPGPDRAGPGGEDDLGRRDQAQDAAWHGALPGPLLRAGAGSAAGGAARHGARRVHRLRAARPGEAGSDRRTGALESLYWSLFSAPNRLPLRRKMLQRLTAPPSSSPCPRFGPTTTRQ